MRTAFRVAALLLALALTMTYFGMGTLGALSGPRGTVAASATSGGCVAQVNLQAYDALTWSQSAVGDLCQNVTFNVQNTGSIQHTFTVSSVANASDNSTNQVSPFFDTHLYYSHWLNASGTPDGTLTVQIDFRQAPAVYEFTCLPHYGVGMYGHFYVMESAPAAGPAAPSFEPFWWIVAVISTLAVLSVVLGIVYGKRAPEDDAIPKDAPITSRPEYFNDSRPEPLDSAEPMKRGRTDHGP